MGVCSYVFSWITERVRESMTILMGLLGKRRGILFHNNLVVSHSDVIFGRGKTGGLKEIGVLGTVFWQNFRLRGRHLVTNCIRRRKFCKSKVNS